MTWPATLRAARGSLTQVQAAAACGYSVAAVRDWEQGRRTPHPRVQAMVLVAMKQARETVPERL